MTRRRYLLLEPLEPRRLLSIMEFGTPTSSAQPYGITTGLYGYLYFTEQASAQIGVFNPITHEFVGQGEYPTGFPSSEPFEITPGPNGNLWFTDPGANELGTFNPTTDKFLPNTIPSSASGPYGIVEGVDGDLWFTALNTSQVVVLNPSTHTTTPYFTNTLPSGPQGITNGSDGNLWFTENSANQIGVFNPKTETFIEYYKGLPLNSGPSGITLGPGGNLWFTENNADQIGMINPLTGLITEVAGLPSNAQPTQITLGPDGAIWFTEPNISSIGMINPNLGDAITQFRIPSQYPNAQPEGIVAGSDGNIWFTDANNSAVGVIPIATQLVATVEPPAQVIAGDPFSLTVQVDYVDTGNTDTAFNGTVSIALSNNPGDALLNGITTVAAQNGVATFNGLSLDRAASGYTISASASGPASVTTSGIDVVPAPPSQLLMANPPPATITAGTAFGVTVETVDLYGNLNPSYSGMVSLALTSDPGGAPVMGTLVEPVENGVAFFSGLTIDEAASGYALQASASGLNPTSPVPFDVQGAQAVTLSVAIQPPSFVVAGADFTVAIQGTDRFGNAASSFPGAVTLALENNPGNATLNGTESPDQIGGELIYRFLTINTAANGYTIQGTGSGVSGTTTNPVNVTPAAASQWVIQNQPSPTATAGQPFAAQPVIDEYDQFGNLETGDNSTMVTASLASGTGPLQGTTRVEFSGGVAAFTNLADNMAETIKLDFVIGTVKSAPSNPIVISPAGPSQLVIHTQPSATATAGQPFASQPVIYEEDQFGNRETGDSSTVVTASLASGTGPLQGMTTATVSGGVASFVNLADDTAETISLEFASGSPGTATSNNIVVNPAAASRLVIEKEPSPTATAGQPFATQPVIYEEDQFGNLETGDYSTAVTATVTGETGLLEGAPMAFVSGGVATFNNLGYNKAETIALEFSTPSATSPLTNDIVVSPAAPSKLVIHTPPSTTATAGQPFATQPVIYEEDQFGNLETGDNSTVVTASLASGSGPLQGMTTATVSSGVASFMNLGDNRAESISLNFASGNLGSATSYPMVVSPAAASQLVIHNQPSPTATAGHSFAAQPVIYEYDQFGNLETGDNSTMVTASLASGTGPLRGIATVSVSGGVATFINLADDLAETIALEFVSGTLSSVPSNPIVVSPAAPSQLIMHTQPSPTATAGQPFAPQPVIYEEDQFGNLETGDNSGMVKAYLASGTGPLQGTATVRFSGGVATFTNLADNRAETISLGFQSGSLPSAVSSGILIDPAAPSQLVIQKQPSPTATAGQPFAAQPVIDEEDQFGNLETGDNSTMVTASLASGTGPLQGVTSVTVSGGVATFSSLADDLAETITLAFTAGALMAPASNPITVTAAAATHLVITAQPPATVNPGAGFGFQVAAEDPFGNVNLAFSSPVSVALATNPGSGALAGTLTVTAGLGIATFSGLSVNNSGNGYVLRATGTGVASATTNAFNVAPRPMVTPEGVETKPTVIFTLQFSTAMNPATAGAQTNYVVYAFSTKTVKRKRIPVKTAVPVNVVYHTSNNSVTLTVMGKNPFSAGGGEIMILASSPKTGVSSQSGVLLNPNYTVFTILANASRIVLS